MWPQLNTSVPYALQPWLSVGTSPWTSLLRASSLSFKMEKKKLDGRGWWRKVVPPALQLFLSTFVLGLRGSLWRPSQLVTTEAAKMGCGGGQGPRWSPACSARSCSWTKAFLFFKPPSMSTTALNRHAAAIPHFSRNPPALWISLQLEWSECGRLSLRLWLEIRLLGNAAPSFSTAWLLFCGNWQHFLISFPICT